MGCWNGTCMISHLPIIVGEKIKLVFLHDGFDLDDGILNQSAYVYSGGLLSPALLPLEGEYDDYGNIEDIVEDTNYKLINKYFKDKISTLYVDGNLIKDWTLQTIIDAIERGEEITYNDSKKTLGLSFVFIRLDIWNAIQKLVENEKCYYSPTGSEYITSREFYTNDLNDILSNNRYGSMYPQALFKTNGAKGLIPALYTIKVLDSNTKKAEIIELFELALQLHNIEHFVEDIRIGWMIQPGAGSQDQNWETYIKFSNIVIDICNKKIKEDEDE